MSLEKSLNIIDYSLSSIWRRKSKTIGVLLVFAAVIFLLASFQMTTNALTEAAARILADAPEITVQKMTAGRQESIPVSYQQKLAKIFGIRKIVPRVWGYYFDETNGSNYTVIGIDALKMPNGNLLAGAIDTGVLPAKGEAVLGPGVSDIMQLNGRRIFSLFRPDLSLKPIRVAGKFKTVSGIVTHDTIFMNLADGRDLFSLSDDMATDLCVYVANPDEIQTIASKISTALPDTRVVTRPQIQKTYRAVFGWRSGFASICLLTALVAFIIFAWDKASGLTPEEKKEIAILKVLGWQTADILALRFWEGAIVSILAFLIGYSLAYVHVGYFSASLFRPILVGWSIIYPSLELAPGVLLSDIMLVFALTVLPYLAATVIPAWRCSIIPPDSAMN